MMTKRLRRLRRRRGYALVEIAMAVMVLMAAMSLAVKVLAGVGQQRRATERRLLALQELANAVERVNAEPFDALNAGRARELSRPAAHSALSKADWQAELTADDAGPVAGKRVTVRVRWKGPSGEWSAPVSLTTWVYQRGKRS